MLYLLDRGIGEKYMKNFKETQDLLESMIRIYEKLCESGDKESVKAKDLKKDINALEIAIKILKNNKY